MMTHISGYFAYLAMVWSRCSRISEGLLFGTLTRNMLDTYYSVSYTHLTLPTIYSV